MEPRPGHPQTTPSEAHAGSQASEDELARQMIARIARQVDLESGRVPLEGGAEPSEEEAKASAEGPAEPPAEHPAERSEEDVSRELVERIAREVDEEPRG